MKEKCSCCGKMFPESKMDFLNADWEGLNHFDRVSVKCKDSIHLEILNDEKRAKLK